MKPTARQPSSQTVGEAYGVGEASGQANIGGAVQDWARQAKQMARARAREYIEGWIGRSVAPAGESAPKVDEEKVD